MLSQLSDGQWFVTIIFVSFFGAMLVSHTVWYFIEKIKNRRASGWFKQNEDAHELVDTNWGWDNNGNSLWNK